jgi:orotate phosphoribosyltransferase
MRSGGSVAKSVVDPERLGRQLTEVSYLEGDFILASGRRSRYYFDKYRFETRPDLLAQVGEMIAERVPLGTQRLAGPELGAVALVTAASLASGIPSLFIRGEAKTYGTAKRIEGPYEPGDLVVVVEDVMTTGGSALNAATALAEAGCKVTRIIGVIDREEGAVDTVRAAGFEMEALFTRSQLDRYLAQ